jgi:hypothetical protein
MNLPLFWHKLPPSIKARFGQRSFGRQRAMAADGHLLLLLHKVPQPGKRERDEVTFWRKPEGGWESGQGGGPESLMAHLEGYNKAVTTLRREYEQARNAKDFFRILEQAAPLQHATSNLHATLQAAREAMPEDRSIIDWRDWAYDLERAMDLLYTTAKNALDFHIAQQSEEEIRLRGQSIQVANRLNLLAAVFFPLTAVSSVFGMNLRSGFESTSAWMFWSLLLIGILLGAAMSWWAIQTVSGPPSGGRYSSTLLNRSQRSSEKG